jgi:hypothetical protein
MQEAVRRLISLKKTKNRKNLHGVPRRLKIKVCTKEGFPAAAEADPL